MAGPGAFGENLCIDGPDERGVYIGTTEVVVTQGRQPCFKLNLRFEVPDMAARVQNSLRAGWYMRVVQPGEVQAGDAIELLARDHPRHSVATLLALIRDRVTDPALLQPVLELPLPDSWRTLFARRLAARSVEDWRGRLDGAPDAIGDRNA